MINDYKEKVTRLEKAPKFDEIQNDITYKKFKHII